VRAPTDRPLVVHIIDELPPDGAERLLVDILRHRSGSYDYRVVCLVDGGALVSEIEAQGVPVTVLGRRWRFDPALLVRLTRLLARHRPVAVHTHLSSADLWGRFAAWLAGVPGIFCTVHNIYTAKSITHRLLDRVLARVTRQIVACSQEVADSLVRTEHIPARRVLAIANGIDLDRFTDVPPADLGAMFGVRREVRYLAVVGRLHEQKGHRDILPVLARLKADGPAFHMLFIGDGDRRKAIEDDIVRLGLERVVTVTGYRDDIPQLLAAVDVVAMPSRWEGLPMALLEAMAMGRAVIASPVGGVPGVIDHQRNGLLVPRDDPDGWYRSLVELMLSPGLRETLGSGARRTVREHYSAEAVARRYESLYDGVMRTPGALAGRVAGRNGS